MPLSVLCCVNHSTLVDQALSGTRRTTNFCITILTGQAAYTYTLCKWRPMKPTNMGILYTAQEENAVRIISKLSNIYVLLTQSIAPSIQGDYSVTVKKGLMCMLMSDYVKENTTWIWTQR